MIFGHDEIVITLRVFGAVLVGCMIGMERTFHGRPAGFRTHALVCVASSLLMIVTVYQGQWVHPLGVGNVQTDPTRMAQGIMTGIGFLGAGVIFKEGLTVRGLTTAASIWVTAGFADHTIRPLTGGASAASSRIAASFAMSSVRGEPLIRSRRLTPPLSSPGNDRIDNPPPRWRQWPPRMEMADKPRTKPSPPCACCGAIPARMSAGRAVAKASASCAISADANPVAAAAFSKVQGATMLR